MKTLLVFLLLLAVVVSLTACRQNYASMDTVSHVDIGRYAGRWYEIARYPHRFEEGCSSVTADYTLQDDGTIRVVNRCI